MAFVITIAQRKGGAGKTTICCQLAAALAQRGVRVAAIDTDDQKSFGGWAAVREARLGGLDFDFHGAGGFGLSALVRRARDGADVVLIDTPPKVDHDVGRAISLADLVLAPLQLSPLDLEASMPTARMVNAARKPVLFVVNRTPPRARIADRIREKIAECELPVAGVELGNRAAFAESLATGRGVVETEPKKAAGQEIAALADIVLGQAGLARAAA